ncbi:MAG: DUF4129 domain-containing protein [Bacillota bacterium]|nr:DUF4129 domain-containing protein [Candidatus Fermentithermobacillaceae bacterium]
MQRASPSLPWTKAAGSALVIGVPAYLWASAFGLSRHLWSPGGWQALLAASIALPFVFLIWADRSSESGVLRRAYLGFMAICLSLVPVSSLVKELAPWVLDASLFAAALGAVALVWQRDRSPAGWQRKTLWAFIAAPVPSLITGSSRAIPDHPSLLSMSLLMVTGVTLCLTENEGSTGGHRPARRLASIAALLFILGYLASSLAPGASLAASWGLRGIMSAFRAVLLELVKPLSILVGWLIDLLLAVVAKGQENEAPLNPFERPELPENIEEHAPSEAWAFIGWVLAAILVIVALRVIWRLLERYASRSRGPVVEETRSSEYSALRAARWALDKVKELGNPLASIISQRFRRKRDEDPLVATYGEFLALAASFGHSRAPSQTPLEFSLALREKCPGSTLHIERITGIFVSCFYGERPALPEELSSMRESLVALESVLAAQAKDDRPADTATQE